MSATARVGIQIYSDPAQGKAVADALAAAFLDSTRIIEKRFAALSSELRRSVEGVAARSSSAATAAAEQGARERGAIRQRELSADRAAVASQRAAERQAEQERRAAMRERAVQERQEARQREQDHQREIASRKRAIEQEMAARERAAQQERATRERAAAPAAAAALMQQEQAKLDALKERYTTRGVLREKVAVDQMVNRLKYLQDEHAKIRNAMAATDSKATRASLQQQEKAVAEEKRLLYQLAKEQDAVLTQGAGAKAGILGVGRNLINNLPMVGMGATAAIGAAFGAAVGKGSEFQDSEKELSAITGVVGADLESLSQKARELGPRFGLEAAGGLDAFKLAISALGPSIAQDQAALKEMGTDILTLAKAGGVDAPQATSTLTDTLNQFGLATGTAAEQAAQMTRITNVMAASAKVGAAEVPDLGASMKVVGTIARQAGLNVEQTAAMIEVFSQAGIRGGEAGTGLRNVLMNMSAGTKEASDALEMVGLKFKDINPRVVGLDVGLDRLRTAYLKLNNPVAQAGFLQHMFGKENAAAANIMMNGVETYRSFTQQVTGTNEATSQAATRMETFSAKVGVLKAKVVDLAIGAFKVMEPYLSKAIELFSGLFDHGRSTLQIIGPLVGAWVAWKLSASNILGPLGSVKSLLPMITQGIHGIGAAARANPLGLLVTGIMIAVPLIRQLTGANRDAAAEMAAVADIQIKQIEREREQVGAQKQRLATVQQLANEYESLATQSARTEEQDKRLYEIQRQLNEMYPGLINSSGSFSDNLGRIRTKAIEAGDGIFALNNRLTQLDQAMRGAQIMKLKADFEAAGQGLTEAVRSGFSGAVNDAVRFIGLADTATKKAEELTKGLKMAIRGARTDEDLQRITIAAQNSISKIEGLDAIHRKTSLDALYAFVDARRKVIEAEAQPEQPKPVAPEPAAPAATGADPDEKKKKKKEKTPQQIAKEEYDGRLQEVTNWKNSEEKIISNKILSDQLTEEQAQDEREKLTVTGMEKILAITEEFEKRFAAIDKFYGNQRLELDNQLVTKRADLKLAARQKEEQQRKEEQQAFDEAEKEQRRSTEETFSQWKERAKESQRIERETEDARIEAMQEGAAKELAQEDLRYKRQQEDAGQNQQLLQLNEIIHQQKLRDIQRKSIEQTSFLYRSGYTLISSTVDSALSGMTAWVMSKLGDQQTIWARVLQAILDMVSDFTKELAKRWTTKVLLDLLSPKEKKGNKDAPGASGSGSDAPASSTDSGLLGTILPIVGTGAVAIMQRRFASGGILDRPTFNLWEAGENGPEVVGPLTSIMGLVQQGVQRGLNDGSHGQKVEVHGEVEVKGVAQAGDSAHGTSSAGHEDAGHGGGHDSSGLSIPLPIGALVFDTATGQMKLHDSAHDIEHGTHFFHKGHEAIEGFQKLLVWAAPRAEELAEGVGTRAGTIGRLADNAPGVTHLMEKLAPLFERNAERLEKVGNWLAPIGVGATLWNSTNQLKELKERKGYLDGSDFLAGEVNALSTLTPTALIGLNTDIGMKPGWQDNEVTGGAQFKEALTDTWWDRMRKRTVLDAPIRWLQQRGVAPSTDTSVVGRFVDPREYEGTFFDRLQLGFEKLFTSVESQQATAVQETINRYGTNPDLQVEPGTVARSPRRRSDSGPRMVAPAPINPVDAPHLLEDGTKVREGVGEITAYRKAEDRLAEHGERMTDLAQATQKGLGSVTEQGLGYIDSIWADSLSKTENGVVRVFGTIGRAVTSAVGDFISKMLQKKAITLLSTAEETTAVVAAEGAKSAAMVGTAGTAASTAAEVAGAEAIKEGSFIASAAAAVAAAASWTGAMLASAASSVASAIASTIEWITTIIPWPFSLALIPAGIAGIYGLWAGAKKLVGFAKGGILERPTFAPMADGNLGVIAEAGPEVAAPLSRLLPMMRSASAEGMRDALGYTGGAEAYGYGTTSRMALRELVPLDVGYRGGGSDASLHELRTGFNALAKKLDSVVTAFQGGRDSVAIVTDRVAEAIKNNGDSHSTYSLV